MILRHAAPANRPLEPPLDTVRVDLAPGPLVEGAVVGPNPLLGLPVKAEIPICSPELTDPLRVVLHLEEGVAVESASMGGVAPVGIVIAKIEVGAAHLLDIVPVWATPLPLLPLEILGYRR